MWENKININEITEIRTKTLVYLGVGAISKIADIAKDLKNKNVNKILIVTGKAAYKTTGAWEHVHKALIDNEIEFVLFDKVTPNPTADQVDEAVKLGRTIGAKAVIGIGGGSAIDAAKTAAILLEYENVTARDIFEYKFTPEKAVPIVAINLTHGTGTEADRFAVVSIPEKEYKPAIAYDFIYPTFAIDDPALMVKLPANQTRYVSIDALNHVVEAATTKVTNPYAILMAKETVRLIAKYLPKAIEQPEDLTSRYYLLYASLIAGISFDNGFLHFTHALEHPLSAVKEDLTHGLGLAVLLPAVIEKIHPAVPEVLADILAPITGELNGASTETREVVAAVKAWLSSVGVKDNLSTLGFKMDDVDRLVDLAFNTPSLGLLLGAAPVTATKEVVRDIYVNSL